MDYYEQKEADRESALESTKCTVDFQDMLGSFVPAKKKPRCKHCQYSKYLHFNGGRYDDGQNKHTVKTCDNFELEE
jgi:hypothetical protein